MKNPYEVLGVSITDSRDVIHSKYRKLAKRYHPDIAGAESKSRFEEIKQAWEEIDSRLSANKGFRWTHGSSVFDILRKEV